MTMLTTTYPLARAESQAPSATTARTWGFWATLGWFGVAAVTCFAASFVCGFAYALWSVLTNPGAALTLESPTLDYVSAAIGMPAAALVLMLAARRRGSALAYIGFALPSIRHVVIGVASLVALWAVWFGVFKLFPAYDQSADLIREYRSILGNPDGAGRVLDRGGGDRSNRRGDHLPRLHHARLEREPSWTDGRDRAQLGHLCGDPRAVQCPHHAPGVHRRAAVGGDALA